MDRVADVRDLRILRWRSHGARGLQEIEQRRSTCDQQQRDDSDGKWTECAARLGRLRRGVALEVVCVEMYVTQISQAPLRILFKASLKQETDGGWCSVREGVPVWLASKNGRNGVRHRAALERSPAGEHFVQDATESPDVSPFVDDLPPRLFGAHVSGCAQDCACTRVVRGHRGRVREVWRRGSAGRLREAKVENLRHSLRRDLDVGRFQVAVNDPFLVSDIETDGD